jgi:hypothetical protein
MVKVSTKTLHGILWSENIQNGINKKNYSTLKSIVLYGGEMRSLTAVPQNLTN